MVTNCSECIGDVKIYNLCLECRDTRHCWICYEKLETDFEKYTYTHLDCVNSEQDECIKDGDYGYVYSNSTFIIIEDDPVYTCVNCDVRISTYHHKQCDSLCPHCIADKLQEAEEQDMEDYYNAREEYFNEMECPYCLMARVRSPKERHGENCPIYSK